MYSYLHFERTPNPDKEVLVVFRITPPAGQSFEDTAAKVAAESSVGTWTLTHSLSDRIVRELAAYVYEVDPKNKIAKIAYPLALFEKGSLPGMASGIMGNIFSMKELDGLRVEDVHLPPDYVNSFPGPSLGAAGIREYLNIASRPIVGSIMKPKIGLTARENAELAYQTWMGGVDLIKDDENLTDLPVSPFQARVAEAMRMLKKAEKETGQKKVYAFNVTAPVQEMLNRARWVSENGGHCIMVDIVPTGWAGVQELRRSFPDMIIHGHRAGHSAYTRSADQGKTMLVLAKMSRLAGIDQLHTGTVVGKMKGEAEEVKEINDFLRSDWGRLKPVMPIASGGLHPGLIPEMVEILGTDLIINFGGGIHGHPDGSRAGAEAARTAVEAAADGQSLDEAAQNCPALAKALEHWSK